MALEFIFTNNAQTTVAGNIAADSTTLQVASGAAFPFPESGQQFSIWMIDAATEQQHEIIYVTANANNQFTLIRGQEGTTAQSWAIGDIVMHSTSAGANAAMAQHAEVQQQPGNYAVDSGSVNAIVAAFTPAITARVPGTVLRIKIAHTNTADTVTLTVNGLAAGLVTNCDGSPVQPGQLVANQICEFVDDGTDFERISPSPIFTNITAIGTARVASGAYGSGDGERVVTLNDFANSEFTSEFLQIMPNGLTFQAGVISLTGTGGTTTPQTFNFPFAFNNQCLGVSVTYEGDLPPFNGACGGNPLSRFQFQAANTNSGTNGCVWFAWGF